MSSYQYRNSHYKVKSDLYNGNPMLGKMVVILKWDPGNQSLQNTSKWNLKNMPIKLLNAIYHLRPRAGRNNTFLCDISATDGLATTAGRSSVHIILTHIFIRTKCTTRARAIISAQDKRNTVCFIASQSWAVSSNNGVFLAVWDLLTPLYICGDGRLSHNIEFLPVATFVQLKLDSLNGTAQFEMILRLIYTLWWAMKVSYAVSLVSLECALCSISVTVLLYWISRYVGSCYVVGVGGFSKVVATFSHVSRSFNLFLTIFGL